MHDQETALPEALAGVDLNLLVAFDALARECSVTRAAARVGLTQSAMSHALRRLRDLLGDPLLVRGRGGMVLTPRAEALSIPLRSGLVILRRALRGPLDFDPTSARRSFRLTSPDLFDLLMLPPLLGRIGSEAPGIDLSVVNLAGSDLGAALETGELDLAILPRFHEAEADSDVASELRRRTLFRDRFAVVVRAHHPVLRAKNGGRRRKLSMTDYLGLSHAMVSPRGTGGGPVDRALASLGARRRIGLRIPSFSTALATVARSDLALTAPTGLSRLGSAQVAVLPPPLELPEHSIDLLWHDRFTNDPAHVWFREVVAEVAKTQMDG